MKVSNRNSFTCTQCGRGLNRLATKDDDGHIGTVLVDSDGLQQAERQSIRMGIPVPYDETIHQKIIHYLRCNHNIPRCNNCGLRLAFFKTKPNPEKNGHNNPGSVPMDFNKITKQERYRFILGLPVEYDAIEHRPINHFANKECKEFVDPAAKKYRKRKEKVL